MMMEREIERTGDRTIERESESERERERARMIRFQMLFLF